MTQAAFDFETRETRHSDPSQAGLILRYMQAGHALTPLDALNLFGCMRLGARIFELRKLGHAIRADWKQLPSGKRVAIYSL
jgi:hypothetical protein